MRKRQASKSAHPGPKEPSGSEDEGTGGMKGTQVPDIPSGGRPVFGLGAATGESRELRLRGSVGQDRVSARELRTGRTQDASPWPARRNLRPRPQGSCRLQGLASARRREGGNRGFRFSIRQAANRQGFGPDGEPAGKPEDGLRPGEGPRKPAPEPPVQVRFRNRPRGLPRLPGWVSPATGQWGPAATPAPITFRGRPGRSRKAETGTASSRRP